MGILESSEPMSGAQPEAGALLADRRARASLRRLAAGEQRKRAGRIAEALRDDGFSMRYIPRLRLASAAAMAPVERIEAAELWVGLPNRRRGLVSAAPLLRDLDKPGMRAEMLRHTLSAALSEVATWPESWRIAVPLPGRTLGDGGVATMAWELAHLVGVDGARLDLQIDESELVEGGLVLHQQIASLRDRGFGVVLEGFGAVFGSLALLPRLPLTGLKLDRRLAHAAASDQADELTLIRASVEIAHRFGVAVTVDGIETETEMRRMRELEVDQVQGPWIGPAMPGEAMRARARFGR